MELGVYVMAPEPISTAYFINSSHQSVSVCVSLLSLSGNDSVDTFPRQRIHNNRRIVGHVVVYVIHILPKGSLWVSLCIPASFLCHNSVNTFPQQREIFGDIVFYAVRVVSKETWRLVLTRTSGLLYILSPNFRLYIFIFFSFFDSNACVKVKIHLRCDRFL
jgi:hypothetical protein